MLTYLLAQWMPDGKGELAVCLIRRSQFRTLPGCTIEQMSKDHRKETVFIIEWSQLPRKWQDYINDWCQRRRIFNHDRHFFDDLFFEWDSVMRPLDGQTWAESLTQRELEKFYFDECEEAFGPLDCSFDDFASLEQFIQRYEHEFYCSLDDFIVDNELRFDVWMIEQNFDLTGVKKILINVQDFPS